MPTLTTTQMNNLQAKLTANDTAGFYSLLQAYGDPYGRLGLAVTNNNTWQGQLANSFAASGSNGTMDYGSVKWQTVNKGLATAYLQGYKDNNGGTPAWNTVQGIHNNIYDDNGIPRDSWLPNKLLNDSTNPNALWNDYLTNTGAADLWGDAAVIGFNVANLKYDPASGYVTPQPDSSDGEFSQNFLKALSDMDKYAVRDMADDFTNNGTIFPILDFIAGLPANMSDFWDATPPLSPFLTGWGGIAGWLAPIVGMQNGNGGVMFPAGNGGGAEPLILDLNGDGAHSTRLGYGTGSLSSTYFDMDNDGFAERTAWVSSGDGLLVMDKNSNGKIDNQTELFGNDATYANGFLNLKQYDSNNDNLMNASDTQWANLRVWVDANGDAVTDAGELKTLAQLGITQINLAATNLTNTWDNENEVGATSTFIMNGQTQQVNDVWFRVDQTSSHYMADVTLNVATLFLPTLKGFGNLKDLHVAMSEDATLLTMMQNFVTNTSTMSFTDNAALNTAVQNIAFRWAGIDGISPSATTQGLNTQTMMFLESITGYRSSYFNNLPANQNVGANGAQVQAIMLSNILQDLKAQLLVQTFGSQLFETGSYNLATGEYSETPVLSSAGITKIQSDLSGITDSYAKSQYWNGLNTFLWNLKPITEFTQPEIDGLNSIWAVSGRPDLGTWYNYASYSFGQSGWSFNGSDLSDYLVGIDDGSNRIWGNAGDDMIRGGNVTNWLYGGDGNDTITSGAGGDWIEGNNGDDIIESGSGNDTVLGGSGNDTYIIKTGSGIDTITDDMGIDTIKFDAGFDKNQLTYQKSVAGESADANDLNIYFAGRLSLVLNDYFLGTKNIESFQFSDETIFSLANTVFSQFGAIGIDNLYGHNGKDFLSGEKGNDLLYGFGGDDTYVFNIGDGQDTVNDDGGSNDAILMGAGITASNIRLENQSNNLYIYYGTSDKIKLENHFYDDYWGANNYDEVEILKFADGSTINLKGGLTFIGTSGLDAVYGTQFNDTLNGLASNDTLYGLGGNDILNGGTGNDILSGGTNDDTYVFNIGDGTDTIGESSGNDTILMGAGITSANIRFEKSSSGADFYIYYGTTDKITITSQFYADYNPAIPNNHGNEIEFLKLADGTIYNLMGNLTFTGTTGNDAVYGTIRADSLIGLAGVDTLYGVDGNDTLNGGTGDDYLAGGYGDDTYVFNIGDGQDSVNEGTGNDTILMGAGITAANIRFEKTSGPDLYIYYGTSDKITVQYHFSDDTSGLSQYDEVETLRFADGSTINLKSGLTFTGTSGVNNLYASNLNDVLYGLAGNDYLYAYAGNDTLNGGAGDDYLGGDAGTDTATYSDAAAAVTVSLAITTAQNTIGSGIDTLVGIENLTGSAYNDTLTGDALANTIDGGLGNDTLNGGSGVDTVSYATATSATTVNLSVTTAQNTVSSGTDTISGFENILGSGYNDTLTGDSLANNINGGNGNDTIQGGLGNDVLIGGSGVDTVSYAAATSATTVNLSVTAAQNTVSSGTDTISGFENILGSAYNDTLTGDALANTIEGGLGNDTLNGGSGVDTVSYAAATSATTVNLSVTAAQNTISSGTDTISGFENILGSGYNDTLTGDALANNINGGNGNDTIQGGLGNDVLTGGAGTDLITFSSATAFINANLSLTTAQNTSGAGTDTISGFENLTGSAYNDSLTGDGNANTIEGGLGNDTLNGGAGIDTVSYASATSAVTVNLSLATAQNTVGAGTDTLSNFENIFASAFNDTLTGSSAANTINGGSGNDLIVGGLGADILTGGLGADTFQFLSTGLDANFDRITDFGTGQADKIDVKNILVGFDAVTSAITDFIEFTTSGANTVVKVDRDGAGTTYGWQQVAQLDAVTGLTDEAALRASGNLIVA